MSEEQQKPSRSSQDVQQEYARLCSQAGHLQYQIAVFDKDLEVLNNTLRELNFEYAAAQRRESEAAKSAEEPKKEESVA